MKICPPERMELYRKRRNLEREFAVTINSQGFICLVHLIRIQQELARVEHELGHPARWPA